MATVSAPAASEGVLRYMLTRTGVEMNHHYESYGYGGSYDVGIGLTWHGHFPEMTYDEYGILNLLHKVLSGSGVTLTYK